MWEKIKGGLGRAGMRSGRMAIDVCLPMLLANFIEGLQEEKVLTAGMMVVLAGIGKLLRMVLDQKYHKYIVI